MISDECAISCERQIIYFSITFYLWKQKGHRRISLLDLLSNSAWIKAILLIILKKLVQLESMMIFLPLAQQKKTSRRIKDEDLFHLCRSSRNTISFNGLTDLFCPLFPKIRFYFLLKMLFSYHESIYLLKGHLYKVLYASLHQAFLNTNLLNSLHLQIKLIWKSEKSIFKFSEILSTMCSDGKYSSHSCIFKPFKYISWFLMKWEEKHLLKDRTLNLCLIQSTKVYEYKYAALTFLDNTPHMKNRI